MDGFFKIAEFSLICTLLLRTDVPKPVGSGPKENSIISDRPKIPTYKPCPVRKGGAKIDSKTTDCRGLFKILNIFGENFSKIWEFLNFKILVALHYC